MPNRAFDLAMTIPAAALVLILLPIIAVLLLINGRPWILRQTRVGQHGRPFTIYKLRTEQDGAVTPAGALMRALNIDELPQIVNVVKADMSYFGPRPLLPEEHRELSSLLPGFARREAVKPGICGHYQLAAKLRGATAPEERLAAELLDLETGGVIRVLAVCATSALVPAVVAWNRINRHGLLLRLEPVPPSADPTGWLRPGKLPVLGLILVLASPLAMQEGLTSSLIPFVVCFRAAVLLSIVAWLLCSRKLIVSPVLPLILIWLAATAAAIVASQDPQWSLWHYQRGTGIFDLTLAAVAALLIASEIRHRDDWTALLAANLICAAALAVIALNHSPPPARTTALSLPTNVLAAYLAVALCLGVIPVHRLWQAWRQNRHPGTIAAVLLLSTALILCATALWSSGARAILVPVILWSGCLLWIPIARRDLRTGLFAAGLALAAVIFALGITPVGDRLLRLGGDPSTLYRVELARFAVDAWLARPWLGWGPDTYTLAWLAHDSDAVNTLLHELRVFTHAHNGILQQLVVAGLVGAVAYLLLGSYLGYLGIRAIASLGAPLERTAFAGALGVLAVHLTFHAPSFGTTLVAALMAGLILSRQPRFILRSGRRLAPMAVVGGGLIGCLMTGYALTGLLIEGASFHRDSSHQETHPSVYSWTYPHLVRQALSQRGDCAGEFLPARPEYGPGHWLSPAWEGYYFDAVDCPSMAASPYQEFKATVTELRRP